MNKWKPVKIEDTSTPLAIYNICRKAAALLAFLQKICYVSLWTRGPNG